MAVGDIAPDSPAGHSNDGEAGDFPPQFPQGEWTFIESTGIPASDRQWTATAVIGENIYVFGGFSKRENSSKLYGDFLCFNTGLREWTDLSSQTPLPPPRHSATMVAHDNKLFLFGGCGAGQQPLADLWYFSIEKNQWTKVEEKDNTAAAAPAPTPQPLPGNRPGLSRAPTNSVLGGPKTNEIPAAVSPSPSQGARPTLTRTSTFSYLGGMANKTTKPGPPTPVKNAWPAPRYSHTAAVHEGFMYVYAGNLPDWTKGKCVWKLDLQGLKWEELELGEGSSVTPDRRTGHIMAIYENRLFIYGGVRGAKTTDEVWSYDLNDNIWTQVQSTGPSPGPRRWHTGVVVENSWVVHGGDCSEAKPDTEIEEAFCFDFRTSTWSPISVLSIRDEAQPFDRHAGCLVSTDFSHSFYLLFGRRQPGFEELPFPEVFCFDWFRPTGHRFIEENETGLTDAVRLITENSADFFRHSIEQLSEQLAPMKFAFESDVLPSLAGYMSKVSAKIANVGGIEIPSEGEGGPAVEEPNVNESIRILLKQIVDGLTDSDSVFAAHDATNEDGETKNLTSSQKFSTALSTNLGCTEESLMGFIQGGSLSAEPLKKLKGLVPTLQMFEEFRAEVSAEFITPLDASSPTERDVVTNESRAFTSRTKEAAMHYIQSSESLKDADFPAKQRRPVEAKKVDASMSILTELKENLSEIVALFKSSALGENISLESLSRSYEEKLAVIENEVAACKKTVAKQEKVLQFLEKAEREKKRSRAEGIAELEVKRTAFVDKRTEIIGEINEFLHSKLAQFAEILQEERQVLLEEELYGREVNETARRIAEMKKGADGPRLKTLVEQTALSDVIVPVMDALRETQKGILSDVQNTVGKRCLVIAEDAARLVGRFEHLVAETQEQLEKHLTVQEYSSKMIQSRIESKKNYMALVSANSDLTELEAIGEGKEDDLELQITQLESTLTNLLAETDGTRNHMSSLSELSANFNAELSVLKRFNEEVFPVGSKMYQMVHSGYDWETIMSRSLPTVREDFDAWMTRLAESSPQRSSPVKVPHLDCSGQKSHRSSTRAAGASSGAKRSSQTAAAGSASSRNAPSGTSKSASSKTATTAAKTSSHKSRH